MLQGLGPAGFWALINHFGSPAAALTASGDQWHRVLDRRSALGQDRSEIDRVLARAEKELHRLAGIGARVITWSDDDYPALLRVTACPPPVLYVHGRTDLLDEPAVAVIGSRSATSYGRRSALALARGLAGYGVSVVSGLAQGIDAEAHAGCLAGGGYTVGVLGCGLDVIYPKVHGPLYRRLVENGLLISEYPLGTRPEPFRFPMRNRIIAGLCCGVVVVEAARRSGTLITVQHALDEGREVFAVPGQIDSAKSAGSHWLLQQGATLVVSADDIVTCLGLIKPSGSKRDPESKAPALNDPDAAGVLELIEPYPLSRDELLRNSGMSSGRFNEILLLLELEGLIEVLPGDRLRRLV